MSCLAIIKTTAYTHTNGVTTYIYVGRTWTYRVYRQDDSILTIDESVTLNYNGTTGVNGENYIAPTNVVVPAGSNYVEFDVKLLVDSINYKGYFYVSASSTSLPSCETLFNRMLSEDSTPDYISEWDPDEPVFVVPPEDKPPVYFGPECDDDLFWEENGCHDFFKYTPMKYINKD